MDKKEIFAHVVRTTAEVCDVSVEAILDGTKTEETVSARCICVFWLLAAGFSTSAITSCADVSSSQVNAIKDRAEEYWKNKFTFHILLIEVGMRLKEIAHSVDEDFDIDKPINHMRRITGKY